MSFLAYKCWYSLGICYEIFDLHKNVVFQSEILRLNKASWSDRPLFVLCIMLITQCRRSWDVPRRFDSLSLLACAHPPPPSAFPQNTAIRERVPLWFFLGKGAAVHWLCFVGSKEYVMCPLPWFSIGYCHVISKGTAKQQSDYGLFWWTP